MTDADSAPDRPRIGVTTSTRTGWRVFPFFKLALWRAGGRAARIHVRGGRRSLDGLDGLVIGGGDDIGVELYGGEIVPDIRIDPARDELEINLIREAEARRLPILGVCRGAQLLNVERGGTLHQDIFVSYPDAKKVRTPLPRKTIHILRGSRLASIKGIEVSRVNALHHQSIDKLGEDFQVAAWDEAGIVQAIESTRPRLVMGVQWHPEYLIFSKADQALFRALVQAAKARGSGLSDAAENG